MVLWEGFSGDGRRWSTSHDSTDFSWAAKAARTNKVL